jgi:hypothetical protein
LFDEDVTARVAVYPGIYLIFRAGMRPLVADVRRCAARALRRETTLPRVPHGLRNPIAAFSIDPDTFRAPSSRRRRGASGMESAMSFLSKAFRRKPESLPPWAAIDQESLRISAAMEHVEKHGNLDAFPGNQNEKLALMLTASRQGLVTWNRGSGQYELTGLGRERLGMRQALQEGGPINVEESGGAMDLPTASGAPARHWALGSGAVMAGIAGLAIGATAMALLPGSTSKAPPPREKVAATAPKPAETGNAPRQVYPLPQPAAPAPAPANSQPEPPKAQSAEPPKTPEPRQAAVHPGEAGKIAGALAEQLALAGAEPAAPAQAEPGATNETASAPAPKPEPNRYSAERSRSRHAPPPANPEEPGLAQSNEQPSARATERSSSRSRHAEQQKSWTESRRKSEKSRREYVEEHEGEPEAGVIVRRFEERGGPPAVVMRRDRAEPSRRDGRDGRDIREIEERRPGFAFRDSREPPSLRFGEREGGRFGDREGGPPRFGLFDWLFR